MTPMEEIRAFIAIELDGTIKKVIKDIQSNLKKSGADVKWVALDNIHLTLKFLGNVESRKIPIITKAIWQIAIQMYPFAITINSLGGFPSLNNPRIIWIGIDEGRSDLIELSRYSEEKLGCLGFKSEIRSFKPHITIGRVRSELNRHYLSKEIKNFKFPGILSQAVNSITLFKSTLTQKEPIHEVLSRINAGRIESS